MQKTKAQVAMDLEKMQVLRDLFMDTRPEDLPEMLAKATVSAGLTDEVIERISNTLGRVPGYRLRKHRGMNAWIV